MPSPTTLGARGRLATKTSDARYVSVTTSDARYVSVTRFCYAGSVSFRLFRICATLFGGRGAQVLLVLRLGPGPPPRPKPRLSTILSELILPKDVRLEPEPEPPKVDLELFDFNTFAYDPFTRNHIVQKIPINTFMTQTLL